MDTSEKTECSEKEFNAIPYDPPYGMFTRERVNRIFRRCLEFDFQSLVGISGMMAEKYSIDSIKSLCEFSPAFVEEADRKMIEELQKKWAPGNWMLEDLSCNIFCQDPMITGKLERAGIASVRDFLAVDNFASATVSEGYKDACKRFQHRLKEAGFPDFIEKQQFYHEQQWQKKT